MFTIMVPLHRQMEENGYVKIPYPPQRKATVDLLTVASGKHMIHGLVEVDITRLRKKIRLLRTSGAPVPSLTGSVVHCCAQVVAQEPQYHAYRNLFNQLVLFRDVDVSVPIERHVEHTSEVVPSIIRMANKKTVVEIDREIEQLKRLPVGNRHTVVAMRLYRWLPRLLGRMCFRLVGRMPTIVRRSFGTVMVTSVGMFGTGAGWAMPICTHTVNIAIGSLVKRSDHEYLCITVSFDHDIIDGAPAARFIHRFKRLLERAEFLPGELE